MLKEKWSTNKVVLLLVSCVLAMLLLFCTLFEYTSAWLSHSISTDNTGDTVNLGSMGESARTSSKSVDIALTPSIDITSTTIDGVSTTLTNATTITNEGTVDALVRVFYTFLVVDSTNNQIATTISYILKS